jgi:hypothetical protein
MNMKDITGIAITILLLLGVVALQQSNAVDIQASKQAEADAIIASNEALVEAEAEEERINALYVDKGDRDVKHDGDPKTVEYKVKLDGKGSSDPDRDKITFQWAQTAGKSLKLTDTDKSEITFAATAGDYAFSLTVTDSYGASSIHTREIRINREMNLDPIVDIKAYNID